MWTMRDERRCPARLARWVARVLAAGALACLHLQTPAQTVPLQDFFRPPAIRSALLSPSGRWLATVVSPRGERARLVVSDLEDKEPARIVAQFTRLDVGWVRWVNDAWLVFDTDDVVNRDTHWDRRGSGLVSVNRSGERMRLLVKREWDTLFPASGAGQPLEANHTFLALGEAGSNEVIVGEHRLGADEEFSHVAPLALDVATGARRSLVDAAPADVGHWIFDARGRARAAVATRDGETRVHWRDAGQGPWRQIAAFPRLQWRFTPRFVDEASQLFVTYGDAEGYEALARFDFDAGRPVRPPLASTPGFSSGMRAIRSRDSGALLGLELLTDARTQVWLVPAMKAVQASVDARLPGRVNLLQCGPCDGAGPVLVHSYADRLPGEYLVYRPGADSWQRIGLSRPEIDPQRMARKHFHRIKARDGADLPLWVTRSAGEGRRPAVVLVHGGPWSRGAEWAWDAPSQFLASRGYVVIEPEFRGSTGYGDGHHAAGWKQWGRAMQDDVSDALGFAVRQGWVDASRVCIAGASYGGYGTLMGLVKDPAQYRCGVAWVGVSDPLLMYTAHWSDMTRQNRLHTMPQLVGDPVAEAGMLKAVSPLERAAEIKAPVLLAYGGRDRRVPLDHGTRMRDALTRAGNPPEWIVYDDEGHGFFRPENMADFWARVEAFLARHLK